MGNTMKYALLSILMLAALTACQAKHEEAETRPREGWDDIIADSFGFDENTPASISLDELSQGCAKVDCIPAIDEPKFISVDEVDFIADEDLILAVSHNGDTRAYAANILNSHEIVNDVIGGRPIAVTWCPLCGSGTAFDRSVDGKVVEFGVSGVLHESDLVMYDRDTRSLWAQITSTAIVGELTGATLNSVPVTLTEWGEWKVAHPDAKVLSTDTGHDKDYSHNRYAEYQASDDVKFPVSQLDKRLHAKEVVFGISVGDANVAYTEEYLREVGSLTAEINGEEIHVVIHADGSVSATNNSTGEELVPVRLFWFAWYTFHPDSLLITG